jgi:hypothetical protein
MSIHVRLLVLPVGLALLAPSAFAQDTPPAAPAQDSAPVKRARLVQQKLNLTTTLTQAYDDNIAADSGSIGPGAEQVSGYFSMLESTVDYNRQGRRVRIGLNGSSAFRYYQQLGTVKTQGSGVGAGFSASLSNRTVWSLNQTASYSPSYLYGLFPSLTQEVLPGALPTTAAPDYALNSRDSYALGTATTLTQGLSRRASLSVGADYSYSEFLHGATVADQRLMRSSGARVELARTVRRHTSLRVGYRFRTADVGLVGAGGSTTEHGLDIGIDTARPLSATRNATFAFSLGSSIVDVPAQLVSASTGVSGATQLYRVSANVTAGYQFGRSWQAKGSYRRGLDYVASLSEPVFVNAGSASLQGRLRRRMDLNIAAGYSSGQSALRTASTYASYTGSVRLQQLIAKNWALFAQYLYYYYDFRGSGLLLLPGVPRGLERNGVRVGLTLLLPFMER